MVRRAVIFYSLFIAGFVMSCKKEQTAESSFYFWKTRFHLSKTERQVLIDLNVKNLYVRFFDIDISKISNQAEPCGVINGLDSIPENVSVIPVVFLTNRTFLNVTDSAVKQLAKQVFTKINLIHSAYTELQMDCDWSEKTKDAYFLFLTELKNSLPQQTILSCTIRLHQVKYPKRSGIPPVSKGMLMFYNMGNLADESEWNSIYNEKNAQKYAYFITQYSLPLDAALPIFNWDVHYRNHRVKGLITKKQLPDLTDTSSFRVLDNARVFQVKKAHLQKGIYYEPEDLLKKEALTKEELLQAASLLNRHLPMSQRRIVFYDLDEFNLKNYDTSTLQKIMAVFN